MLSIHDDKKCLMKFCSVLPTQKIVLEEQNKISLNIFCYAVRTNKKCHATFNRNINQSGSK